MASVWDSIGQKYNYLFGELSEPLTKDFLFIRSPLPLITILLIYNLFCTKIGPWIMKNRPPYKLNTTIKIYNIIQILTSLYLVYQGVTYIFSGNFNFRCEGLHEIYNDETKDRLARAAQVYFLTRLVELLDTVFFVLRKSHRQITFLHLYHHTLMPIASWITVKYVPGGQPAIVGTINSLVHVFMYAYYLLSGMGPQYQKYLWWKKHLTIMQIVQFVIVLIHSVNSLFHTCSYITTFKVLTIIESLTFIYMFSMFYFTNYIKIKKKKQDNKETVSEEGIEQSANGQLTVKKKN